MIEKNILDWMDINDSIQKIDIYNSKFLLPIFTSSYLNSRYNGILNLFFFISIVMFFFQVWELNITKTNTSGDGILNILDYIKKIFLLRDVVKNSFTYILVLTIV